MQKARASRALLERSGRNPVFSSQDFRYSLKLALLRGRANGCKELFGNSPRSQVPQDAGGAVFARQPVRALLGEALVGKLLARSERIEQLLKRCRRLGARGELACQLGAGMLAAREQP